MTVAGRVVRDPDHPTAQSAVITVDDVASAVPERIYLALNKPRGLVTSVTDERGRDTIYRCLDGAGLPWLAPVGRLDKASEGLLLLCNDPQWAALVSSPDQGPDKVYHVQIDTVPDDAMLKALVAGREDGGEFLRAKAAHVLRAGERNAWLEIVLDRGRNRHIRRLLAALDVRVLRLVRVTIGSVQLGDLQKGQWRQLTEEEVAALAPVV